jgi:hypothetical protein
MAFSITQMVVSPDGGIAGRLAQIQDPHWSEGLAPCGDYPACQHACFNNGLATDALHLVHTLGDDA